MSTNPDAEAAEPEPEEFSRALEGAIEDVAPSGASKKWVVARINTDTVDNFGTVLAPEGMDKSTYTKNPVVLWEHGKDPARGRVPIGRNMWVKYRPERRDILAKTAFADDEFSRGIFDLYRGEFLRAWSVNGIPSKDRSLTGPPTKAELSRRADLARCKTVYRSWLLTEYSAVSVPGNPDALTEDVSRSLAQSLTDAIDRGLWVPDLVRERVAGFRLEPGPKLPPLRGRTMAQVQAAVQRQLAAALPAMIEQARQDALDIARGRV